MTSVSIYLFAGDFTDVLRRYQQGIQQIYQTHNEVARLIHDLLGAGHRVTFYSFVTPERRDERPIDGFRFVSLGAKDYSAKSLLKAVVLQDDSEAIVAHFSNLELLRAVASTNRRAMVVFANSYNKTGFKAALGKWRVASLLNKDRFELVSNHCLPATEHLASFGVQREKLIAWDVPHPFNPSDTPPKALASRQRFEAVYAGSIMVSKGVADLIHAIALLRQKHVEVHCTFAGLGDVGSMQSLGVELGVTDLLSFAGLIGNTDVFQKMAAADLVVIPSRTEYPEGFPLTMFEAIASRTPIVCSDHPMFRTVLFDGRNASIFPAGDHNALATAMRQTLTNPTLYTALSKNADLTWATLKGPADWRTMIVKWVAEGAASPWIRQRLLSGRQQNSPP